LNVGLGNGFASLRPLGVLLESACWANKDFQVWCDSLPSPPPEIIGLILGLIFGLSAGLTSVLLLDMLARFLLPRPPLVSGFRCDPAGLMMLVVGLVTVFAMGADRVLELEECKLVEDPGVLSGPSFGVLRADILGVSSPPSLTSWSPVSMRPSAGLVAAGSGRLSSSMTVPFGEMGNS
jgi:hypothetical protein